MDARKTMDKLNELSEIVDSCYLAIAKENNLTYNALMLLLMVDYYDNLTQKQVCDALFLSKSSVHSILSDLIKRGYLLLTASGNKKEKYIVPTDDGKVFIKKVASETERMENAGLEAIPDEEISRFLKTAQAISTQMTIATNAIYREENDAQNT